MLIAILESLEVTQSSLKSLRQIVLIITGKVLTMPTRTSITRADERTPWGTNKRKNNYCRSLRV